MKPRYIFLNELANVIKLNKITLVNKYKIPYYHTSKNIDNEIRLTVKHKGNLNINKIKYVKLTVVKSLVDMIDLKKYTNTKNEKNIRLTKPEFLNEFVDMIGLTMDYQLFELILLDSVLLKDDVEINQYDLRFILHFTIGRESIKFMDKNYNCLAYGLQT